MSSKIPNTSNIHRMIPHHQMGARSMSLMSVMALALSTSKGWMTFSTIGSVQNVSSPLVTYSGSIAKSESLNDVSVKSCFNWMRPSGRVVVSILPFSTISMPSCSISPNGGITTCSFASCVTLRCIAVWSPNISIVESILAETTMANKILIIV